MIKKLNIIITLGLIAVIGILIAQLFWTKQAYNIEEKKFSQKVQIALLEVAKKIYDHNDVEFPTENPIKKVSNDYYVVNVNSDLTSEVLKFYLKEEFNHFSIITDFEYGIYDCSSDKMIYGEYISINDNPEKKSFNFPEHQNLEYYFAIRFPKEKSYLFGSMRFWLFLTVALMGILLIYVYSIYNVVQHKKVAELQRDFINGMTHEFKTPLSSILLASSFLEKQEFINSDEKLKNYTNIIINQSTKLNQHVERVLNIAKSDEAVLNLEKEEINLAEFLKEAAQNMNQKHENLEIQINIPSDIQIVADKFHFYHVISNLMDNAAKYGNENPKLKVFTENVNQEIKLNFTDNGKGISNKNLPYIFDKFYREKPEESSSGFGLGLFYVKNIVKKHHWKITAKNNEIGGMTFTIALPKIKN